MIYGGVSLLAGGSVVIARYALVSGAIGISITGAAGTITDSGAVFGSGGTAIQFDTFNDALILDTTASFIGKVDGGAGVNTLELRTGATAGTLSALGTGFVNFGHVVIDPGANWTVEVGAPTVGQTIAGSGGSNRLVFQSAGTIDLSGVTGIPTIVLSNFGATTATLGNANFVGLSSPVMTVIGGNIGNTVDASALTGTNRVILVGGVRADHFTGGGGNDVFKFSAANLAATDTVVGGAGSDELLMTSAGTVNAGGVRGVENVQLASGAANSLTLTSGNFTGVGSGKIIITDGNSGNTVSAATLPSNDAIIVHAGTGTDTLKGGAGADLFYAGGKTKMTGGDGANRFTFADIGANTIADFAASSSNMIVLRDSGFNLGVDEGLGTGSAQHLAASVFVANSTGSFTTTGQRVAYNTTTGALRYDKDGNGASFSASTVVVLSGHPSLGAGASGQIFFTS
jgi:Ca2+-binding RTX toxin-like protein